MAEVKPIEANGSNDTEAKLREFLAFLFLEILAAPPAYDGWQALKAGEVMKPLLYYGIAAVPAISGLLVLGAARTNRGKWLAEWMSPVITDFRWWVIAWSLAFIYLAGLPRLQGAGPNGWLDRLATATAAIMLFYAIQTLVPKLAPYFSQFRANRRTQYLTGNLGFLDHAINSQHALKEYTSAMMAIGEITRRTSAVYNKRTAQLNKLLNRPQEVITTQGHRIAKKQAKYMIATAAKMEPYLRILTQSSKVFFDSQLAQANLLDPAIPEQRVKLLENIAGAETLKKTMESSRDAVAQYKRQIQGFKSASQDLSGAVDILSEKLARVFVVMNDAVQFCDKVRRIQVVKITTVPVPPPDRS
jgi:hypothetical protein